MERLPESNYALAGEMLRGVPINTYFAQVILTGQVEGVVYADNIDSPTVLYFRHPYGMTLLLGSTENATFNAAFADYMLDRSRRRERDEWMQAYPEAWGSKLRELLGESLVPSHEEGEGSKGKVVQFVRVNFRFDRGEFERAIAQVDLGQYIAVPTTREVFDTFPGSVTPKYFWKSAEHFLEHGFSLTLLEDGGTVPASTAFTSYVVGNAWEIGIESDPRYRGRGLAFAVCAKFIEHCLPLGKEPIWSCRKENVGSYMLAKKLGFQPVRELPYYRLIR